MPAPEIHLDRIQLTLRGVSPAVAQGALASLGPALEAAVAARLAAPSAVASPDASANVRLAANATPAVLRDAIAANLATTIAGRIGRAPSP